MVTDKTDVKMKTKQKLLIACGLLLAGSSETSEEAAGLPGTD